MKKLSASILLLILLLGTSTIQAQGDFTGSTAQLLNTATVPPVKPENKFAVAIYTGYENSSRLYIRLDNPDQEPVSISFLTEHQEKLYVTQIKSQRYNICLNLSNLENGVYRVQVANATQTVVRTLRIQTYYEKPRQVVNFDDPDLAQVQP